MTSQFNKWIPFFQRIVVLNVGLLGVHVSLCFGTICEWGSLARKLGFWNERQKEIPKLKHENHIYENWGLILTWFRSLLWSWELTWEHTSPYKAEHHHKSLLSHTAPSGTWGSSSCLRTFQKTSDIPEISDQKGVN